MYLLMMYSSVVSVLQVASAQRFQQISLQSNRQNLLLLFLFMIDFFILYWARLVIFRSFHKPQYIIGVSFNSELIIINCYKKTAERKFAMFRTCTRKTNLNTWRQNNKQVKRSLKIKSTLMYKYFFILFNQLLFAYKYY